MVGCPSFRAETDQTSLSLSNKDAPRMVQVQGLTRCAADWCKRHDVLDVKRRPLQRLVHSAILTAVACTAPNLSLNVAPRCHAGFRPKRCNASARTKESVSLSSTSASRSSRSRSVNWPSVLRSISSCRRRSACGGNRSLPTDSTQSTGAEMTDMVKPLVQGRFKFIIPKFGKSRTPHRQQVSAPSSRS